MFSRLLRRTHMYLALFLAPWVLMYAVSTATMNHRKWFEGHYGEGPAPYRTLFERKMEVVLPEGAAKAQGAVLLASLGLEGAFTAQRRGEVLVVQRQQMASPLRVSFDAASSMVKVEEQEFRANGWLERMHRRRGYQQQFAADLIWAVLVDTTIAAMLFWALSGLWMWWEMKATRALGGLALAAGAALFAFYLAVL